MQCGPLRRRIVWLVLFVTWCFHFAGSPRGRADDGVTFFERRIRPVLVSRCYACHSADAASKKTLKAGLRLDSRDGVREGGDSGPAIVPGKPDDSLLVAAIRHESIEMPPKGKLADNVIADFVHWIRIGAPDPRDGSTTERPDIEAARRSWVFQSPRMPTVPDVADESWPRNEIDRLVLAALETKGLEPAPRAGETTLIRRAAYDLLGLPPTPEEVDAFVKDDRPDAFVRVVDSMLQSPDFGVRWARHWLDNVRYAGNDPTCNANSNGTFSIGPYRDWVVKAFNEDLPYDEFVRMQIAGDLMGTNDPETINVDGLTATGIWGLAHLVEGNDKEKVVADFVDEQLDVLGRTFLGLTLACARCHDHKFDPIQQSDYYALSGIFYSSHVFTFRGKSARTRDRLQRRAVRTRAEQQRIAPLEQRYSELDREIAALEDKFEKQLELKEIRRELEVQGMLTPPTKIERIRIQTRIKDLQRREQRVLDDKKKKGWDENPNELQQHANLVAERNKLSEELRAFPVRIVMQEGPVPGTRHQQIGDLAVFIRGDHLSLGPTVPRGIPRVFSKGEKLTISGSGRLQLAEWLTRPDHPLTARVMANRVWQHLFGRGIVATPSNFGRLGQPPTHPELLDALAIRLVKSGWKLKSLIRDIMLSQTYQQASQATEKSVRRDPNNRWFGRMNRKRLGAEALVDALAWHRQRVKRSALGAPSDRLALSGRTLFEEISRDGPQTSLDVFDGPNPDLLLPQRADSTSAPQALFMMNNETVLHTAMFLSKEITSTSDNEQDRVGTLYRQLFAREATAVEYGLASETLRDSREARGELAGDGDPSANDVSGPWEDLCLALICSNEFLYID